MAISLAEFLLGGPDTSTSPPEPANGSGGAGMLDDDERARCLDEISRLLCEFAKEWKSLELAIADLRAELAPKDFSAALAAAGLDAIEGILDAAGEGPKEEGCAAPRRGATEAAAPRAPRNGGGGSHLRTSRSAERPQRAERPAKPAPAKPDPGKPTPVKSAPAKPDPGNPTAVKSAPAKPDPENPAPGRTADTTPRIDAKSVASPKGPTSAKARENPAAPWPAGQPLPSPAPDGRHRRDESNRTHEADTRRAPAARTTPPQSMPAEGAERSTAPSPRESPARAPARSPASRRDDNPEHVERTERSERAEHNAASVEVARAPQGAPTAARTASSGVARAPADSARGEKGNATATEGSERADSAARETGTVASTRTTEAATRPEPAAPPAATTAKAKEDSRPAAGARNESRAASARAAEDADRNCGIEDAVSAKSFEPMPSERALEGGLHRKLEEVLALLKSTLDGRAQAAPPPVLSLPSNLSQEIALQVAGRIRESMLASLPPAPAAPAPVPVASAAPVAASERATTEQREPSSPPRPPPREAKRIPIGDVASLIDQLNGRG